MRRSALSGELSTPSLKVGGGGQTDFATLSKPFSLPVISRSHLTKRKRYTCDENRKNSISKKKDRRENRKDDETTDSDDEGRVKKKKWDIFALPPGRVFPVFDVNKNSRGLHSGFKIPASRDSNIPTQLSGAILGTRRQTVIPPRPLHDPMGESAIVLYDPTVDTPTARLQTEAILFSASGGELGDSTHKSLASILGLHNNKPEVDRVAVVIDPKLCKVLRPHQIEGVKFLYRCVTGAVVDGQHGCIMADAMGLGKTLQCITLLWTLLRQSPTPNKPTIDKAIVACPASLVSNWANELDKWLGKGSVRSISVDGKLSKATLHALIRQWSTQHGRNVCQPVLIVSYEGLSRLTPELGKTSIGLLLCDEGHRLKNQDSQTYKLLQGLNVTRRVLLTGTPIQNDLTEYYSLLNFINPGYLGSSQEFRKNFELAILKGRDSTCSEKERDLGDQKIKELTQAVNKFVIRRTNDLLTRYLPVKYEHVVFCTPTRFQLELYHTFLNSDSTKSLLKGKESQPLKAINVLKKLVNHPDLLDLKVDIPGSEEYFPAGYDQDAKNSSRGKFNAQLSGKMAVLERFLDRIKTATSDKIVLVSNFTQTLDLMEKLCRRNGYRYFRLDGSMGIRKRQNLVDKFNNPDGTEFVFLLSSKAGGCGINLIGANRLVLFDPDWNPASDQQALARVWRDGQKKTCFVYRFITTGTVEEKIFQRQAQKQQLSSCVVDEKEDEIRHFSRDELRELFKLRTDTKSDTHDTFKCKRCNQEGVQILKAPAILYGDTSTWNHFTCSCLSQIHDDILRAEASLDSVSAVFQFVTTVA